MFRSTVMLPRSIASDMCCDRTCGSIDLGTKPRIGSGKTGLSMNVRSERMVSPSAFSSSAP